MEYKKFDKNIVLRVQRGEEIMNAIQKVAEANQIKLATVEGIGACDKATVGLYEVGKKEYHTVQLQEEMELTSLIGNITTKDSEYYGHFHANFGLIDGSVKGGHLNEAWVSGTAEIFINIIDGQLDRTLDEQTGLNLIKF